MTTTTAEKLKTLGEQQDRFSELWQKCLDGTITTDEKQEMLQMQIDYWTKQDENALPSS